MGFLQFVVDLLGRLGFNTTRLKWKLFQFEKRSQQKAYGIGLPASLQWMAYPHKRCRHCNGLVDRAERICPHCGKRAPTMIGYRITRLLGLALPRGTPAMLGVFVVVMVAHFLLTIAMQGWTAIFGPTRWTIMVFGAWSPITAVLHHEYWRYLSFGLAHAGIIHIGFNLFALTQVGPIVEERIGPWRMLVLITVAQLASAFASYIWYFRVQHAILTPTVGASGWLFGLIGFGITYFGNQAGSLSNYRQQLIQWGIYSLIFGFIIGANNAAHVGGLIAGLAVGKIPEARRQTEAAVTAAWNTAAAVSAVLWIVTLAYLGHSIVTGWSSYGKPPGQIERQLVDRES